MRPETKRARGKRLLADLSDVVRRRSTLRKEQSDLELRLSMLDAKEAEILSEIAAADVELETGNKRRKDARPALSGDPNQEMIDDVERSMRR